MRPDPRPQILHLLKGQFGAVKWYNNIRPLRSNMLVGQYNSKVGLWLLIMWVT